ncbi:hypothetical protein HYH02_001811 [Chlamydomonas schloesseri]|uniref:Replication factor C subunit 1 n=1 Tax=Chlamydomonas schloesseri TaxID=2026947 RepID=A0A836BBT5_9CHLO|nr:hypothetical protein HYH02_001811 [Chlamydomonas schloesseri]|eukprot:KAG2453593.1 hypothetical protein HYH02_001811 [Chlamydomonas schloesseri]
MGKSEASESKSPKKEDKQPPKPVGKDIRSFFSKPPGGASKPAAAAVKTETGGSADTGAAKEPKAVAAVKPEPKAGAAAKPAASASPPAGKPVVKKSRVIIDEEDSDDFMVVDEKKRSTPKKQAAGGAAADNKKPGSAGKGSGGKKAAGGTAPAAKKRRVVADDDDDDVVEVSSEGTDGDEEYKGGDESSDDDSDVLMEEDEDEDDSDVVMDDSEEEEEGAGGKAKAKAAKAKGKAAAAKPAAKPAAKAKGGKKAAGPVMTITPKGSEPEKKKALAGTKHARSPAEDEKGSAGGKKAAAPAVVTTSPTTAAARRKAGATKAVFSTNPGASEAIAAVDAAAAKLPPESEVNFSLLAEGEDGAAYTNVPPPNQGNKEAPRGHPDCLTGKTFVISGVLDSLGRDEATDYIKRHGGRTTQAVSGKTTFLLVGHHCGRSKFRKARELGTKVIDEDGLIALIRASEPNIPAGAAAPPATAAPASQPQTQSQHPSQPPTQRPATQPGAAAGAGPSSARPAGVARAPAAAGDASQYQLWVDKYKPRNSVELVGNNTLVDNLRAWLLNWEQVHLRGAAAPTAKGGGSKPKDLSKKAALLSGPPGIGKTSAAHIIAREAGFEVVEMNASDTRNKAGKTSEGIAGKQSNIIKEMVTSTTLPPGMFGGGAGAGGGTAPRRQLLVMDEVDGMSGGDRGGIQDLIDTIKRSKIPIICICNDKYNQKLKSLRNHCLELEFRKPTTVQISKRMSEIAAREGLSVNQATMEALVTGAGGDLRLILGQLQMVRLRSVAVSFDDVKSGRLGSSKDTDRSPFECSRQLLEPSSGSLSVSDRLDLVFADSDLVPLLLQENYLNHKPAITSDAASRLRAIAKAADAFSLGDVLNTNIRRYQNWGLMPATGVVGCVLPCAYMRGVREVFGLFPGEMNFPRFSAWFGNNSTSGKQRRLLGELATSMSASGLVSAGRSGVRLEYACALRQLLARPLQQQQEAAVPRVVQEMHEYCIDKEQFDYIMDVTSFKSKAPWAADLFKDVPPKVKAAFTRMLNSTAPAARCNAQVEEVKLGRGRGKAKGKGGRKGAAEDDDDEEGGEGGEGGEEEAKPAVKQEPVEGEEVGEEGDDDEDVDARTLARRLAKGGLELQLQDDGKGGKGKKSGAAGSGGGRGKAAGAAAKPAGGRGGGRGGGKAAGKK